MTSEALNSLGSEESEAGSWDEAEVAEALADADVEYSVKPSRPTQRKEQRITKCKREVWDTKAA